MVVIIYKCVNECIILHHNRSILKSPYNSVLGPAGSIISGASVVNAVETIPKKKEIKKLSDLFRSKTRDNDGYKKNVSVTPHSGTRITIITPANVATEQDIDSKRQTPAITIQTPLRGNIDSPLKPFKIPENKKEKGILLGQTRTASTAPAMGKR